MTFFLVTKLSHVQDEIVLKKFQKFDATAKELIWSSLCDALMGVIPSVKETLARGGFVKLAEESLEIKIVAKALQEFCDANGLEITGQLQAK